MKLCELKPLMNKGSWIITIKSCPLCLGRPIFLLHFKEFEGYTNVFQLLFQNFFSFLVDNKLNHLEKLLKNIILVKY